MRVITAAGPKDLPQVLALLKRCGLPQESLHDSLSTMIVVQEADQAIGCAALEVYGTVALLRSVAVDPAYRSRGLGQQLVEAQLEHRSSNQVKNDTVSY